MELFMKNCPECNFKNEEFKNFCKNCNYLLKEVNKDRHEIINENTTNVILQSSDKIFGVNIKAGFSIVFALISPIGIIFSFIVPRYINYLYLFLLSLMFSIISIIIGYHSKNETQKYPRKYLIAFRMSITGIMIGLLTLGLEVSIIIFLFLFAILFDPCESQMTSSEEHFTYIYFSISLVILIAILYKRFRKLQ